MTIDHTELTRFLVEAIPQAYAGDGEEVSPWTPEFKELEYPKDGWPESPWYYCDSYQGFYQAPGREVVYFQQQPVWCRVYHGGMLLQHHGEEEFAKATFVFLKHVLGKIDLHRPYWRGPSEFTQGDWRYESEVEGDLKAFRGEERIYCKGTLVFQQWYGGGMILKKDTRVVSS